MYTPCMPCGFLPLLNLLLAYLSKKKIVVSGLDLLTVTGVVEVAYSKIGAGLEEQYQLE